MDEYRFLKFFAIPVKSTFLGLDPNSLPPVWDPSESELDGAIRRFVVHRYYFLRGILDMGFSASRPAENESTEVKVSVVVASNSRGAEEERYIGSWREA